MLSWVVAIVIAILSLAYGLLVLTANMMSDNPTEQMSGWPCGAGLLVAVAIGAGHHYGAW